MRTMCSQEIFMKKCCQQQIFDSDLKGAWHYNHMTFTPIAKNFMLYCRLIYTLSILCVRLTIKVKVGIPDSFKVGWYPLKKTGSNHLKLVEFQKIIIMVHKIGKAPLTPCPARFQLKSDGQEKSENNLNFVAGVKKKNEFIHR